MKLRNHLLNKAMEPIYKKINNSFNKIEQDIHFQQHKEKYAFLAENAFKLAEEELKQ